MKPLFPITLTKAQRQQLAQLLELRFEDYSLSQSPLIREFLKELRFVIGLGYTAALVENELNISAYVCLKVFLDYGRLDTYFKAPELLCASMAQLIDIATYTFYVLGYPAFYDAYIASLKRVILAADDASIQGSQSKALLEVLFPKVRAAQSES